ncbi:MAG: carbohydrate kinase family protein [Pelolinea sp.]|nr:carbohydrate kinase family protein [Pelolinea sp.]
MKEPSVFCYGEIGVDNIIQADCLPTPEIAVFPSAESYHIGGAAANTAVWLAHIGIPTGLSGNAIGNDLYGQQLKGWLGQHNHLDLSNVEIIPRLTTPFTRAIVTPDGERSFLIFYYPQTPKTKFSLELLNGARYLALDLYGGPERLMAAKIAHEAGIQTAIGDIIWPDHAVLPYTSIATNSGSYIRTEFPGIDVRQHAHALQSISKGIVITTDGGEKIYAIDKSGTSFTVTPLKVEVVDATGAGDAFRAGLLYGLVNSLDLPKCVCLGVAAGSLKVGHLGAATTLPSLEEIISLANTLKTIPVQ